MLTTGMYEKSKNKRKGERKKIDQWNVLKRKKDL